MKTIQDLSNKVIPIISIDKSLDKYKGIVLFPKKLEMANEMLKTAKLPKFIK